MVNFYLNLSTNYQAAAEGALIGGHIYLFKNLLDSAPENYEWDFGALSDAVADSGKKEIIGPFSLICQYLFRSGLNFNKLLYRIARSGNENFLIILEV